MATKLGWLGTRQGVLAENVANANTPSYKPADVKAIDFKALLGGTGIARALKLVTTAPTRSGRRPTASAAPTASSPTGGWSSRSDDEGEPDRHRLRLHDQPLSEADRAHQARDRPEQRLRRRKRSMDLNTAMQLAYGGMSAQGTRLKVIAENLANADSTAQTPAAIPTAARSSASAPCSTARWAPTRSRPARC